MSVDLSIIVPLKNEEANLSNLWARLEPVLRGLGLGFEVLLINDGSTDLTADMLDAVCEADSRFACLHFSHNFGHQLAVSAGLMHLETVAVCVLDADLKDPPSALLEMLQRWKEG